MRQIFGRHENQRSWIVQEVLISLIKLPDIKKSQKQFQYVSFSCATRSSVADVFVLVRRLRDGRAIHIVSALLLQLIQSCTYGVRSEIEGPRTKAKSQMIVNNKEEDDDAAHAADLEKQVGSTRRRCLRAPQMLSVHFLMLQELKIYHQGVDASAKSAKSIAMFLVQS